MNFLKKVKSSGGGQPKTKSAIELVREEAELLRAERQRIVDLLKQSRARGDDEDEAEKWLVSFWREGFAMVNDRIFKANSKLLELDNAMNGREQTFLK